MDRRRLECASVLVVGLVLIKPSARPHRGKSRKIHQGQKIHISATEAKDYTPRARPFGDDPSFWLKLHDKKKEPTANIFEWLELDLYYLIKLAVEKLGAEGDDTALKSLRHRTLISGKLFPP